MADNGDGTKGTPAATGVSADEVRDIVSGILESTKGDKQDALERLVRRNERLQLDLDKSKAAMPDSSRVLSDGQFKTFEAYKKLGSPEDITKIVSERDGLQTDATLNARVTTLKSAAEVHGYQPALFLRLAMQDNLLVDEIREEGEGDEKVKVAYVRVDEEGSKPVRLDQHAKENWSEFMGGLSTEESASRTTEGGPRLPPSAAKGSPPRTGPETDLEKLREKKLATGAYKAF